MYAFQTSTTGYQQIDPTTLTGRPYDIKYHNVGQLMTPYEGKPGGTVGDYGPPQSTRYFTDYNSNYPYPLDSQSRPGVYIPMPGSGECGPFQHPGFFETYNPSYPGHYIASNYFAPQRIIERGHDPSPQHPEDYDPARYVRPPTKRASPFLPPAGSSNTEEYTKLASTGVQLARNTWYYPKGPHRE
jgi:hypothetical protein